jgi:hypothetical protein
MSCACETNTTIIVQQTVEIRHAMPRTYLDFSQKTCDHNIDKSYRVQIHFGLLRCRFDHTISQKTWTLHRKVTTRVLLTGFRYGWDVELVTARSRRSIRQWFGVDQFNRLAHSGPSRWTIVAGAGMRLIQETITSSVVTVIPAVLCTLKHRIRCDFRQLIHSTDRYLAPSNYAEHRRLLISRTVGRRPSDK